MRIAQVSPLFEAVPPKQYGGTERVVHSLTEELVALGHSVTLFATADSETSAELVPCAPRGLRLDASVKEPHTYHVGMLERVLLRQHEFDVVHFHMDYLHFPLVRRMVVPTVTTQHNRQDLPELLPLYREFSEVPVVSISNSQRAPLAFANWAGTVYHGYAESRFDPSFEHGDYFAFLGRISPEKRVDRAIDIALALGVPLKIAAKIDRADREYYETQIAQRLDHPLIEFLGEVGEEAKGPLLRGARALLFPIDWPEPFGLVMIEAMACGTPVVAFEHGSVPEVIDNGVTGFVVRTLEEAIAAAHRVPSLERRRIRESFVKRFSSRAMAEGYLGIYRALTNRLAGPPRTSEIAA
jgi:glycosyltransferase involved in cell wall biosynthesis